MLFPSYFFWLGGGLSYSSGYSFCTCWSWIYCFFCGVVNRCCCWPSYCFNTAIYPYWRDYFLLQGWLFPISIDGDERFLATIYASDDMFITYSSTIRGRAVGNRSFLFFFSAPLPNAVATEVVVLSRFFYSNAASNAFSLSSASGGGCPVTRIHI
jgi:hypothetical protein